MTPASAQTTHHARPAPIRWGLIFAVWTAYGILASAQHHIVWALSRDTSLAWWVSFLINMPNAWTWALATPGIIWLGRRFPFERGRWATSLAVHITVCLAFIFYLEYSYALLTANVPQLQVPPRPVLSRALQFFVSWVLAQGLFYWTILSVSYAALRQQRLRERELAASQLETQLAQADLQALKMQLHPHFLFNALHTIGSLVRTGDRDKAVRVVAGLGDLLRRLLDGAAHQEVPLKQELDFIRSYLEIEQVRFQDRLRVRIDVDEAVLDATVPHLILQPLVENAIRHGIEPHLQAGQLLVAAHRVGDRLELLVRDDGPGNGVAGSTSTRPGIGLTNTRARLERLYDGDYRLDVGRASGGGHEARVELPFRLATAQWEGER